MSRKITVRKDWRGPTLRLTISAIKKQYDPEILATEAIDVNGLVMITGTFQPTQHRYSYGIDVRVATQKCAAAKNSAVLVNISMDADERRFFCTDESLELNFGNMIPTCLLEYPHNSTYNIQSYTVVINITAYLTWTTPSVLNNHLYEDEEFTDFQLHTPDGTVAVHKAVLALHGDMLKTMLRGDCWKENKESRVNVEGANVQTLQHLKQYMYLGTLPDEGLESLLIIAVRCLMEKLEADCITKMILLLKPENFRGLIEFAYHNKIPKLVEALVLGIPDRIVNRVHEIRELEARRNEAGDME